MRTPPLQRQVVSATGEQREKGKKKELVPTVRTLEHSVLQLQSLGNARETHSFRSFYTIIYRFATPLSFKRSVFKKKKKLLKL